MYNTSYHTTQVSTADGKPAQTQDAKVKITAYLTTQGERI
jgi:hypothetical protein